MAETTSTAPRPRLRKDGRTIRSMFARVAPRYDLLNHVLSLNVDKRWRRRCVRLAAPRGPVLDVCCGTGDLAAAFRTGLRKAAVAAPVVAADFCAPMVQRGKSKKSCKGVAFACADTLRLPFPDGGFDVVSVGFGIRNVSDLDAGLREMVRVARPGGRVVILEFARPSSRIVRGLFDLHFRHILPRVGNLMTRSRAYTYLRDSVLEWLPEGELRRRMLAAGCEEVQVHRLSLGVAAVHVGTKTGTR